MQRGTQAAAAASVDDAQLGDIVSQASIEHDVDASYRLVDGEPVEVDFAGSGRQRARRTQSIVGGAAAGAGMRSVCVWRAVCAKRTNATSVNDKRARLDLHEQPPVLANFANGPLPHRRLHPGTDDDHRVRHGSAPIVLAPKLGVDDRSRR